MQTLCKIRKKCNIAFFFMMWNLGWIHCHLLHENQCVRDLQMPLVVWGVATGSRERQCKRGKDELPQVSWEKFAGRNSLCKIPFIN